MQQKNFIKYIFRIICHNFTNPSVFVDFHVSNRFTENPACLNNITLSKSIFLNTQIWRMPHGSLKTQTPQTWKKLLHKCRVGLLRPKLERRLCCDIDQSNDFIEISVFFCLYDMNFIVLPRVVYESSS